MKEKILARANELSLLYSPCWRWGQSVFNATYELYPDAADSVRGTSKDCYYNSNYVNEFLDEIEEYEKCIKHKS